MENNENNVNYVCNTPNGVNEKNFVRNGSRSQPLRERPLEGYGTRKRLTYSDDNVDNVRAGKRQKSPVIRNSINNMRRRICKEGLQLYVAFHHNRSRGHIQSSEIQY